MSSFIVTGKQGHGKSLIATARIFHYLLKGNKVATNLDIYLDAYLSPKSKRSIIRLPDKPTVEDFKMIGSANEGYDEEKNGLLVLDELGAWFNTRAWQDKGRKETLEHFLYLRKLGWDVFLLVHDIDNIDGQLRDMLGEHLVVCRRLDRIKIPFIGNILKAIGFKGTLPKMHRARVYFGETERDILVDTWNYFGKQFYKAYNTKQIFSASYPHGVHSLLSPWHTKGRYLPAPVSLASKMKTAANAFLEPPVNPIPPRPKHPLVERVMRLPDPAMRLEFIRRFEQCGAFS